VDEKMKRVGCPPARAASSRLSEPPMLTRESNAGSATLLRTSICAARWQSTSKRPSRTSAALSVEPMSPCTNRAPRGTCSRRPLDRSSSTVTS
jgi:hypothetical protein